MSSDRHLRCGECGTRLPPGTPMDLCPFCVPEEPAEPGGRSLGGCELYEELGRGGMGVVWRGWQRSLQREVAVKTLPGGEFAGAEARARFRTEAHAAARLSHPGIVTVHEVGEEDGMPYLVMELVRGRTLSAALAARPVGARLAARWVRDIALAIAHAHREGVLHRDLKPSNILIEEDGAEGRPRVSDFGLAKLAGQNQELTLTGSAMGSPAFMPPEQAAGRTAAVSSDVYGLGALLYFTLTGRPPFQGETVATVMNQVIHAETVPPRRLNASVPEDLQNICLKCLEKNAERRYGSAQELADDLERFLDGREVKARPLSLPLQLARLARRYPARAAALLAALLLAAGLMGALHWRAETEHRHAGALAAEQRATREALARSRIEAARSIIRLQQADSAPRALALMESIAQEGADLPQELHASARDTALAALALPQFTRTELPLTGRTADDWTLIAPDFPRQRWFHADFGGTVEARSMEDGRVLASFSTAPRKITALIAASPGGRWLAMRHRDELGIWDTSAEAGERLVYAARIWDGGRSFGLMQTVFTADDAALLHSDGTALVNVTLPAGKPERIVLTESSRAGVLALTLQETAGRVVVSLTDEDTGMTRLEIRQWPGGSIQRTLPLRLPVLALAASPDGEWLAAGDTSGMTTVWRRTGPDALRQKDYPGHTDAARGLAFHAGSGLLASSSEDGTLRLWDCTAQSAVAALPVECGVPAFHPDGYQTGAGTAGGRLFTAACRRSALLTRLHPPAGFSQAQRVFFTPAADEVVALANDGAVSCLIADGSFRLLAGLEDVETAMPLPDGSGVLTGSSFGLQHWPADGTPPRLLAGPVPGSWAGLNASADGSTIAAWGRSTEARLFPVPPGPAAAGHPLVSADGGIFGLTLSPDAARAAISHRYEPGIEVLDASSGSVIHRIPLTASHYPAWSPDGIWLAACGGAVRLWDTRTWQEYALQGTSPSHPPAGSTAFSWPDASGRSRLLASVSGDNRICLYDLRSRELIATLEAPGLLPLFSLSFSRDHRWLAAGAAGGEIQLWNLQRLRAESGSAPDSWRVLPAREAP